MKKKIVLFLMVTILGFALVFTSQTPSYAGTGVFKWRMVTSWPSGIPLYAATVKFAERLKAVTGGRLDITVYPAGALVPPMEVFDTVSKGTAECGSSWSGYWIGKNPAAAMFGSMPMGLDTDEYFMWLYHGGGMELWRELYHKYNMVPFAMASLGQEIGLQSKKPVRSIKDLKGLRVRYVGWAAEIMSGLGASVSPIDGSELYLALDRGVLDAGEFSIPSLNVMVGLHKVTKYLVMPGWHQPGSICELMINKDAYNKLPDDLKAAVDSVSMASMLWSYGYLETLNIKAIQQTLNAGLKVTKLGAEDLKKIKVASEALKDRLAAKDPFFAKVLKSQRDFKKGHAPWRDMKKGLD